MGKTQKQKRDERAEKVCREVRFQISQHGGILDTNRLFGFLESWMKVTGKIKYVRPEIK